MTFPPPPLSREEMWTRMRTPPRRPPAPPPPERWFQRPSTESAVKALEREIDAVRVMLDGHTAEVLEWERRYRTGAFLEEEPGDHQLSCLKCGEQADPQSNYCQRCWRARVVDHDERRTANLGTR